MKVIDFGLSDFVRPGNSKFIYNSIIYNIIPVPYISYLPYGHLIFCFGICSTGIVELIHSNC